MEDGKEGSGPLGQFFDVVSQDSRFGQKSWELAESEMQKQAIALAAEKAGMALSGLDCILAGDLLNQCIGSSLASVDAHVPYLGLYGACSTMAQGLALGAALIDGGTPYWRSCWTTPTPGGSWRKTPWYTGISSTRS